jgi:TorA maturation chaperone TorD
MRRAPGNIEDHPALLCDVMGGLARGQWRVPQDAERELFQTHLAPWIGHLFADLEAAEAATFYRSVGTLGRIFIAIESKAFALTP